ncbi:OmpH family outer membrane protein [Hyphomonas sp.]|jgi:Skp family chaperone for outer membrane proteins|uniref:OmpH family outer membrane protein n=1 Tax=Hyphomonas sp. TaxID=87 RepID=UPI0037C13F37
MTKFKTLLTALMLSASTLMVVAPSAAAQGTVIMVIDESRIIGESKAGKDMFTKLKNIETQINAELKPTRDALEAERKALATKLDGKTREAIVADAALVKQIEDFQKKTNDFAQMRTTLSQEYAATEQKSFIDFNTALEPVMLEVVKEKNAQIVLSKSQAVFTADTVDATASIVAKLDQKTPAITVVRQRAPAPQ